MGIPFHRRVREPEDDEHEVTVHRRTRASVVVRDEIPAVPAPTSLRVGSPAVLVSGVALVVAVAALGLSWGGRQSAEPSAALAVRSIAVLPFRVLDDSRSENAHLELAMADAVISRLGRLQRVSVRSTSAVRRYAEVEPDR